MNGTGVWKAPKGIREAKPTFLEVAALSRTEGGVTMKLFLVRVTLGQK
jgi:hypothetical protein